MGRSSTGRRGIAGRAIVTATLVATVVMTTTSGGAGAVNKVVVFYAACDGTGATDTVKIKRVDDDATNGATVGDSGIANCAGGAPTTRFAGLAVDGEYG
mgnify:FL=1